MKSFKITTQYREYGEGLQSRSVKLPQIRFGGRWLEKAGFKAESRVRVIIRNQTIILQPI